jgi:hypothetical protein
MDEPVRISSTQLEGEYRSVGLFVENAKTYIQLATGALLLSVTFSKGITGESELPINELYLWISWLSWLAAILTGVTYQYCVAKYLEDMELKNGSLFHCDRAKPFVLLRHWVRNPYQLYGALMLFFYGGTTWFAGAAALQLMKQAACG